MEKSITLNIPRTKHISTQETQGLDLGGYFQILIGILMTSTFLALALILLNIYYGRDEKETEKD